MILNVSIELNGMWIPVGILSGTDTESIRFSYCDDFLERKPSHGLSVSLPLQREAFTPEQTACFFDGLLPEGFTRGAVADSLHIHSADYIRLLGALGKECIGALRINEEPNPPDVPHYKILGLNSLKELAEEGATASAEILTQTHLSLAGATGKVGLYYDGQSWYLPEGTAPSTHIVKQSHVRLNDIVVNEQLCLLTAKRLGLPAVTGFIVETKPDKSDGSVLFATSRFDRIFTGMRAIDGLPVPSRLHQEDFSQALGIPASEKYENDPKQKYFAKMADLIRRFSARPLEDLLFLWDAVVFDFLIGNTDNHLKNYSFLYNPGMTAIRLAPIYDMISTVSYRASTRETAFSIGGDNSVDTITEASFKRAAKEIGLGEKFAMNHFYALVSRLPQALADAAEELNRSGFTSAASFKESILSLGGIAKL